MAPQMAKTADAGYGSFYTSFQRRNQSLELMNPPADSPLRKTSLFFGTFNLVATIVGGGVLSLPWAFAKAGLVLSTIMMVFSALITDYALYLLCCCARRTGSATYIEIVRSAFGPVAEIFMTAVLWCFLSGVLIAFNVLLKGIFAPLGRDFVSKFTSLRLATTAEGSQFDNYALVAILLLVSPLMLKKDLYGLRHISYVGFASVCVIVVSIAIRAYERNTTDPMNAMDSYAHWHPAELIGSSSQIMYFTTDLMDILYAFPIIVLAFLCAYNVVEIHRALQNPTRERVKGFIHTSITSCFFLFEAFGLAGYFYAYDACRGNIFLNFDPSDNLIMIGRMGMGLTLMFATPVVILPCREAFLSLTPQLREWWNQSRQGEYDTVAQASEADALMDTKSATAVMDTMHTISYGESDTSSSDEDVEKNNDAEVACTISHYDDDITREDTNSFTHIGTTVMIATYCYFGAVSVPGVAVVWSILGSSLGMVIGFIVPCACYLKIRGKKGLMRKTNFCAFALLVFSSIICVICTAQSILKLFESE